MRKYNITYSCGHEGRIDSFGKIANREKKVVLIVLCFTIALMFCSCNFLNPILRNESNSKGSYVLCDRQKKILKQEGLPLDYEELDGSQKNAIDSIEDIFKYLDKTYPKEKFEYLGYVPYSTLEPEHLIVESQYGEVTVNRYVSTYLPNFLSSFDDDFKTVKAADIYATVVDDYLAKKYDTDKYLVDVYASEYLDDTYDTKTITEKCDCNVNVYVNDELGMNVFENISKDMVNFMKNKTGSLPVSSSVYLINRSDFSMDLPEEFMNGLSSNVIKKHIKFNRRLNGEEKVYEVKGE